MPLLHPPCPDGSSTDPNHPGFHTQERNTADPDFDETRTRSGMTADRLPVSESIHGLESPMPMPGSGRRRAEPPSQAALRRGGTAGGFWGVAFATGTLALSIPASVFLHRGMAAAGLVCLLFMAGCLVGAMMLLDPLRK